MLHRNTLWECTEVWCFIIELLNAKVVSQYSQAWRGVPLSELLTDWRFPDSWLLESDSDTIASFLIFPFGSTFSSRYRGVSSLSLIRSDLLAGSTLTLSLEGLLFTFFKILKTPWLLEGLWPNSFLNWCLSSATLLSLEN